MTINSDLLIFCQGKLGDVHGDGECWTLVEDGLVGAGGKSSRDLTTPFGDDADYVWGTTVGLGALTPGDMLQFRNYRWDDNSEIKVTWPSDGTYTTSGTSFQTRGHHSAVVESRDAATGLVTLLEQNVPPGTETIRSVLCLQTKTVPKKTTEEQRPHPTTGRRELCIVETTINYQVRGSIWGYRGISAA